MDWYLEKVRLLSKFCHIFFLSSDMVAIMGSNCYEYDAVIIGGYRLNLANVGIHQDTECVKLQQILSETKCKDKSLTI